jgi:hypothetical protein
MRRSTVVKILCLSIFLDMVFGIAFGFAQHVGAWNGLYFATTTGSTVGYGDITPHGWLPHLLSVAIMILVIPLFTSVFSLMTTALTTRHVDRKHEEMKRHVSEVHSGRPGSDQGSDSDTGSGQHAALSEHVSGVPGHDQSPYAAGDPPVPGC